MSPERSEETTNPPSLLAQRVSSIEQKTGVRMDINAFRTIFVNLRWDSGTLGDAIDLELRLDLTDEARRTASAEALRVLADQIAHSHSG
jgi:hypothetical protein